MVSVLFQAHFAQFMKMAADRLSYCYVNMTHYWKSIMPAHEKTGLTDFCDVTLGILISVIKAAFVPKGTSSHPQKLLDAGETESVANSLIDAVKIPVAQLYGMI